MISQKCSSITSSRNFPEAISKTRAASITKVGVAMAAMALYEDGTISLDGSIGTYWGVTVKNPYYPDDPVSVRSWIS